MVDEACVKASLGIPSLGMRTAPRGERLVSGTPPKEGHLIEGSQEEGKPHCHSPEAKYDFKILISSLLKVLDLKPQNGRLGFPVTYSDN